MRPKKPTTQAVIPFGAFAIHRNITLGKELTGKPIKITRREAEILALIFAGNDSQKAAAKLNVSKRTIDFHLGNAYKKLNVGSRMQAFQEALSVGLVQPATQTIA